MSKRNEISVEDLKRSFIKGIPFAYLMGEADFYHHKFFINQSVLIPRQETEFLVDLIIKEHRGKNLRILDVGTGSGVILLSLLLNHVGQTGIGVDISEQALEVARSNINHLGLCDRALVIHSDRLTSVDGSFDLIVSNPPYIKLHEHKTLVHSKVNEFEPHEALYLSDEFYDLWFEGLFIEIRSHLNGTFYMEGHELEVERQAKKLAELGFTEVVILKDLTGSPRFIKGSYKA